MPCSGRLAFLVGLAAVAAVVPLAASADSGSPNYRSKLDRRRPEDEGARRARGGRRRRDRAPNATGANVMVPGYEGEPYLRFLKSGRVEVNVNSPARYLNEERYGGVAIPRLRARRRRRSGS